MQEEGDDGLPIEGVPLDGLPLDVVSLSLDRPQALDGVPVVKDDLDGMPMGDPDLDGLPITASEDLDGAPGESTASGIHDPIDHLNLSFMVLHLHPSHYC